MYTLKSVRMLFAVSLLSIVLSANALAGQIDGVGTPNPPPPPPPGAAQAYAPIEETALTDFLTAICGVVMTILP